MRWAIIIWLLAAGALALGGLVDADLWSTPEQRGRSLLAAGKPAAAAAEFADPLWIGVAWQAAGEYAKAEQAFARVPTATGSFDRGNAQVMQGRYEQAVASYDRALALRPGWMEAEDNRRLAKIRQQRTATTGGDQTGGQVKADEVTFDGKPGKRPGGSEQTDGGAPTDAAAERAEWLRRVQTRPADFLRAKFASQIAERQAAAPAATAPGAP